MGLTVAALLAGAEPKGKGLEIAAGGVNADSRAVVEGDVFFALPGTRVDGNAFIPDAARKGAAAIVTEVAPKTDPGIPVVLVKDVRAAYAKAAARALSPQPDVVVGVTGTNGKTSVVSFVRQLWAASGVRAASIGTLGTETGSGLNPGSLTTPDALTLHKQLHKLKLSGCDHVALEASSHGLDQRRLDGIGFKAVGFTNLSRDHLDYHPDIEAYRDAKMRLFRDLLAEDGVAVVNSDDPEHLPFMFAALDRGVTLLTVGEEGAYFEISSVEREGLGQKVTGKLVGEPVEFVLPLAGRFQVDNAVMAAALALHTEASAEKVIPALNHLKGARGRMELVGTYNGAAIFVDYSHKPVALQTALETLRPYAENRLSLVFGCGGDRDKGKRPMMGEIAAQLADRVIVTDDNPRTESPAAIRAQILAKAEGATEIGDRARAIYQAVAQLQPGDVLLVAGKGHEDYQIVGTEKRPFSDHKVVADAIGA